jgi:hypothetical protein
LKPSTLNGAINEAINHQPHNNDTNTNANHRANPGIVGRLLLDGLRAAGTSTAIVAQQTSQFLLYRCLNLSFFLFIQRKFERQFAGMD